MFVELPYYGFFITFVLFTKLLNSGVLCGCATCKTDDDNKKMIMMTIIIMIIIIIIIIK